MSWQGTCEPGHAVAVAQMLPAQAVALSSQNIPDPFDQDPFTCA